MIALLEKQFEDIKEKFAEGSLIAVFAKFELEKLMEEINYSLNILKDVGKEDAMKKRFIALKKQLVEFDQFLDGFLVQNHSPI